MGRRRIKSAGVTGAAGVLVLTLATSCTDVSGPDRVSNVGILEHYQSPPRIELPTTATVGESIEVAIETYGVLGCTLPGETMVRRVDDLRFEITPIDVFLIPGPGPACPSRLVTRRHVARISFDRPGVGRVVVRGRSFGGGSYSQSGELFELERALTVTID
jgi:hypothetical protein